MANKQQDLKIFIRENEFLFKTPESISVFSSNGDRLFSITWIPSHAFFQVNENLPNEDFSYYRIFEDALFRGILVHGKFGYSIINELPPENFLFGRIPPIVHFSDEMITKINNSKISVYCFMPDQELTEIGFSALSKVEKCEETLMQEYFESKKPYHQRMYTELYQYYPSLGNIDH